MAEKTVAAALSGYEVKQAILDRVTQVLDRDCFLHPDAAYDSFSGKISWEIGLHAVDTVLAHDEVNLGAHAPESEVSKGEVDVDPEPPNVVRVKSGQPVPTDTGKGIKYSREVAGKK